jgi:hypothetical protein
MAKYDESLKPWASYYTPKYPKPFTKFTNKNKDIEISKN